jgi:hypothetical protein
MLGIRTYRPSVEKIITEQKNLKHPRNFYSSVLKGLQIFWQFSCFYGNYVSQPLESRQNSSVSAQKSPD